MSYIGQKPAERILTSADISDAAITAAKLASSSVTQPKVNSGVAGTGPAFSASPAATTTLTPLNSWVKVTYGTEVFDTNNCYDPSTSRFQPNVAGYYFVSAGFGEGLASANQTLYMSIAKNGTNFKYIQTIQQAWYNNISIHCLIYLNGTTDYIEVLAQAGASYTNQTNAGTNWFQASMVRAA